MKLLDYQSIEKRIPIEQAYPYKTEFGLVRIAAVPISNQFYTVPENYKPFLFIFDN